MSHNISIDTHRTVVDDICHGVEESLRFSSEGVKTINSLPNSELYIINYV